MNELTILCSADRRPDDIEVPGGDLPYGLGLLRRDFDVDWVGPAADVGMGASLRERFEGVTRRLAPGLRGLRLAAAARSRGTIGPVLSVFEDAGLAFARADRGGAAHVLMCCWMAQDVLELRPSARRSIRASVASAAAVCVYSSNQVEILCAALRMPSSKVHVVPFGVDTGYFDPARVAPRAGGGGLVAVGSDSRRDYRTLFDAVRITGLPITVACQPRNIRGLDVPPSARLVQTFDGEYRALLHSADLVVTPTTAPAYPSGQSVVLEAMSMGRATLTSDSAAMREYVDHGVTGMLVPAGDAHALATAFTELLADATRRERLGTAAQRTVRERFSLDAQWTAVSAVLKAVSV